MHSLRRIVYRHKPFFEMCIITIFLALFSLVCGKSLPLVPTLNVDWVATQTPIQLIASPSFHEFLGVISLMFAVCFWVVYYSRLILSYFPKSIRDFLHVYTLGDLLEEKTLTRKTPTKMRAKVEHTTKFVQLLASIAGIIATLGLILQPEVPSSYQTISRVVTGMHFIALVLLIISADRFDTCLNEFEKQCENELCAAYYKKGLRCAYIGMHLLLLSFVTATLIVSPILTLILTTAFFFAGYPYWFPRR